MEKYEALKMEVISFEVDDVLDTAQGVTFNGGSGYYYIQGETPAGTNNQSGART